ncbi:MAG: DUF3772 domain-containing protein [Burkholderiaceae bacterium]|jgi:small-conductance mechanosensitive channel|nr:DUF3772 domain-containing protein [Burkholderiaceae bacterium]
MTSLRTRSARRLRQALTPSLRNLLGHGLAAALKALALLLALASGPGLAQDRSPPAATAADGKPALPTVDELRKQLDAIPQKLGEDDDGRKLLAAIADIGTAADQVAARRATDLADIDSRLAGLGPAPEKGAPADAPDVAEQRASLARQRSAVDADLKLARLVSVDADQRGNELIRQRREQFQAELTARTDSPLGSAFWRNLRTAVPQDLARLQALGRELRQATTATLASERRGGFLASLAAALLVALLGPWLVERLLVRMAPARLPSGRLRRSLRAAATVLANTLLVGLAAQLAWSVLRAGDDLSPALESLAKASVQISLFAAFVVSLGQTLLSRRRSSWRLPGVSDDMARRLSPYPWWIAAIASLGALLTEVNSIVGASLAAEVTVHALSALLTSATVMLGLRHLRAPGPACDADGSAQTEASRPLWVGLLVACAGLACVATIVLAASGFVALAGTMARQMVWTGVVFATTYLLFQLSDDLCEALLSSKGGFGGRLNQGLGIDARLLDQAAVLFSGLLRVALFFYMIIALLAPLGTGPDEVFRRGSTVNHSLKIGEFTIAPQALFTALAVVCTGLLMIRVVKRWLTDSYFPNTALEPGMRSSITTLLGYVGGIFVVAVALAGLGISVERIAWVASALSVGIGFGLQAIVQNFISGLILLAERPVKVGDWVVLGDTEGDVRRVNVRATEIQLGDRSTVIVPNSEFITKTVRNMTLAGAPGRVLLRLPAPLDTDAERMRSLILEAFRAHEGILDSPEPVVQLEGIANGTLTFLAIGYVGNPRNAGSVKSDVLFGILASLKDAGLYLSPPATTSVTAPVATGMPAGTDPADRLA